MDQQPQRPAMVNPLPPVIAALFFMIIGIEAAFTLGARGVFGTGAPLGWRLAAIEGYGVNSPLVQMMLDNGQYPVQHLMRFVGYLFVHGALSQAIFAAVMVLAIGKIVGEVFSGLFTLMIFIIPGVIGAFAYGAIGDAPQILIGAFPGVYGLIGGFTYLLWRKLDDMGAQSTRAFGLIGMLMGLQLIFAALFGGAPQWIADLTGFIVGFVLALLLTPGGWTRVRNKIRHE